MVEISKIKLVNIKKAEYNPRTKYTIIMLKNMMN